MNNNFEVSVVKIDVGYIVILTIEVNNYFDKIIHTDKHMMKQLEISQIDFMNLLIKYNAKCFSTIKDTNYYFESIEDANSFKNYIEDLYTQKQVLKNLIK